MGCKLLKSRLFCWSCSEVIRDYGEGGGCVLGRNDDRFLIYGWNINIYVEDEEY